MKGKQRNIISLFCFKMNQGMNSHETDELPLYARSRNASGEEELICLGFFAPEHLRPMISRKEATMGPKGKLRCVILTAEAPAILRARALSSAGATQALSTTYTEDLYPDTPEQLAYKGEHEIPLTVTATMITLRKYRGPKVGFVPWGDNDRFARRRFNPDLIRPLHYSDRAAMAAKTPPAGTPKE